MFWMLRICACRSLIAFGLHLQTAKLIILHVYMLNSKHLNGKLKDESAEAENF